LSANGQVQLSLDSEAADAESARPAWRVAARSVPPHGRSISASIRSVRAGRAVVHVRRTVPGGVNDLRKGRRETCWLGYDASVNRSSISKLPLVRDVLYDPGGAPMTSGLTWAFVSSKIHAE